MTKSELREIIKGTIRQIKENAPAVAPARPKPTTKPDIKPGTKPNIKPNKPLGNPGANPDRAPKNEDAFQNIVNRYKSIKAKKG